MEVMLEQLDAKPMLGALNIGIVPTFGEKNTTIAEVYIMDFEDDLYGKNLILELFCHIRNEKKFDNVDVLIKQIKMDIEYIKNWNITSA